MIGYGLFRPKGCRVMHVYGPVPSFEGALIVKQASLCKRAWPAGVAFVAWASHYNDTVTPDEAIANNPNPNRSVCSECRKAAYK